MEWGEHEFVLASVVPSRPRPGFRLALYRALDFGVFRSRLIALIWVIVGVALAAQKHYLDHFGGWRPVLSAILAILLWPLLLLGINLHIHK